MSEFPSMPTEEALKLMREAGITIMDVKDLPEEVQEQLKENRKKAEENIQKEKDKFNKLKERWEEIKKSKQKE